MFLEYYYDKRNVNVEGNLVVGTDYPNCVNFIVFMIRKAGSKMLAFLLCFQGEYPRNEESKSLAYINVCLGILNTEIGNNGSMI